MERISVGSVFGGIEESIGHLTEVPRGLYCQLLFTLEVVKKLPLVTPAASHTSSTVAATYPFARITCTAASRIMDFADVSAGLILVPYQLVGMVVDNGRFGTVSIRSRARNYSQYVARPREMDGAALGMRATRAMASADHTRWSADAER
jgi:hypothetical protein